MPKQQVSNPLMAICLACIGELKENHLTEVTKQTIYFSECQTQTSH